jgi:glycine dehydrogenase subunit 1
MDYTQLTPSQREAMLKRVGAGSIEDLLKQVPAELRLKRPLEVPAAMDEMTLRGHLAALASRNRADKVCFLGAGAYEHFIPSLVDDLASKSEFVTAYTPYQAEASQGSLQAFFEFQTLVCRLTGMDVANASLYEGATATAEGVMMALSTTGKRRVLVSRALHPDYRRVLATYLSDLPAEYVELPLAEGVTDLAVAEREANGDTACIVLASPNFLGQLERVERAAAIAKKHGALTLHVFNPISLGMLKRPGDLGADVATGEGQPLGIPLAYGGPYLGLFATRSAHMRRMPGRLVGQTVDAEGKRAFCLTLQTREQHIRREKATSNVCTNQGLLALRAAIYMATMGPQGLREVATLCHDKAAYFAREAQGRGLKLRFAGEFFNEVVVELGTGAAAKLQRASEAGVAAGYLLEQDYPELAGCLLVAFTEMRTRDEIDQLVNLLA